MLTPISWYLAPCLASLTLLYSQVLLLCQTVKLYFALTFCALLLSNDHYSKYQSLVEHIWICVKQKLQVLPYVSAVENPNIFKSLGCAQIYSKAKYIQVSGVRSNIFKTQIHSKAKYIQVSGARSCLTRVPSHIAAKPGPTRGRPVRYWLPVSNREQA